MSVVLPPPLPSRAGGPVLNNFPPHPSPATISRVAVQQQLLDNLSVELDRQAAQRRAYRLPRDVVDVGTRPEADDMQWITTEKLKFQRMTANLRRHATCPNQQAAVAKFDRHVNNVATEFRSRYATEHHSRQSNRHKQPADRRAIQARYSSNPPLCAGTTSRTSERTITSPPLGGIRSSHVNVSADVVPFNATPTEGSILTGNWDKAVRPAGPCISRLKTSPSGIMRGGSSVGPSVAAWRSDVSMSRSASNRSKGDPNLESDIALVENELVSGVDVPHYVEDVIDYEHDDNFSDVSSQADLVQVDHQQAQVDQPFFDAQAEAKPAPPHHYPPDVKMTPTEIAMPEALAFARDTVTVNEASIRAMCYWLAIHVVGRLAYSEPARHDVNGSSSDEWDQEGVVDRSAKRVSGSFNFEPESITSPRPTTPIRPHRVYGKIPSDPYGVLNIHGSGHIIRPDSRFVDFLVHLVYEKEVAIETIVAAAWFIDGLSVHDTDGEFGKDFRQVLLFSNPGESFAAERRLVMIGLYLADMSVSDNHWALSAWADSCMVPRPQSRLMERNALASLRHSINIAPKAWLDHCNFVYSSVARLRIDDAGINWTLLEVCHKMVITARSVVAASEQYHSQWTAAHNNLPFDKSSIDTSRMDEDQENVPLCPADDDDEYEEFDGAGNFPQPVFKETPMVKPYNPPVRAAQPPVSAPALQAALVAVTQASDNDMDPSAPVFDDDDHSDYEPYDGAGHFPMPAIKGRANVTQLHDYHYHNPSNLHHPRAVPRSPVQLARVRPVLNRFETLAALMTDAPYRFPTPRKNSGQCHTTQIHFYPGTAPGEPMSAMIPPYPVQPINEQLSVPSNPAWPPTNPMNTMMAAQPYAARPPLARLSPVTAHPGDVFPKAPLRPRADNMLSRKYRNPGFFRERYVPPPTPAQQYSASTSTPTQFDPFAEPRFYALAMRKNGSGVTVPPLEPTNRASNPLFSPSSEGGTPNTPTGPAQVWRRREVAPSCERPLSPAICVSAYDQNWY